MKAQSTCRARRCVKEDWVLQSCTWLVMGVPCRSMAYHSISHAGSAQTFLPLALGPWSLADLPSPSQGHPIHAVELSWNIYWEGQWLAKGPIGSTAPPKTDSCPRAPGPESPLRSRLHRCDSHAGGFAWICCSPNLPKVSSRTYSKKAWRSGPSESNRQQRRRPEVWSVAW